jgi:predicted DNA-binding transcriptional regulator YafY
MRPLEEVPMARNSELVRQWEILREIDAARTGIPIAKLASMRSVHVRTIRRDLDALCRAGFPLFDDKVNGTSMWKLRAKPFRGLEETGLSILEMCALYFSRSLLQALGGAPFEEEMNRAFAKLERALPVASRRFLDQLPLLIKTKASGRKKHDERKSREVLARVLDASLSRRRVGMQYHSASSQCMKDYVIEPLRVCCADGGIYVTAWVREYGEMRTFALERIRTLGVRDDQFEPRALPPEPFANSLGVFSGSPELVEIEFDARSADYVRECEWHRSQEIVNGPDGAIVVRLCVCDDRALRAWILSFGASAQVLAPANLVKAIYEDIQAASERYSPRSKLEMLRMMPSTSVFEARAVIPPEGGNYRIGGGTKRLGRRRA